jgi:hypothetical protein
MAELRGSVTIDLAARSGEVNLSLKSLTRPEEIIEDLFRYRRSGESSCG